MAEEKLTLYFKTSQGNGRTNAERAFREILCNEGTVYFPQKQAKISLTLRNKEWKLRIDTIDYINPTCEINGIQLEINEGISRFIEQDVLLEDEFIEIILEREKQTEEFLEKQLGKANTMKRLMGFSDSVLAFKSAGGNVIIRRYECEVQIELSSTIES